MPESVLTQLPFAPHGGPDGEAEPKFDFSVNGNPFGPPPDLLLELAQSDLSSYPDPTYRKAHAAAAAYHGVTPEHIVLGSASDLIYRLAACYLDSSKRVLIAAPTFGEYARASLLHGAGIESVRVYERGREPDAGALQRVIAAHNPALVFLCQPNNPTGHVWSLEALAEIARACERADALLVIDTAYLELSTAPPALPERAVQLVPLTKTFALAGLRVGYAVAPPDSARILRQAAPPWPVSSPAQVAVCWCRSGAGRAFVSSTVPALLELRHALEHALRDLGFGVWASASSFVLLETSDNTFVAEAKRAGFRLRDTASLGLPGHVRLAAQTREANEALLSWLGRGRG